jgi:hypothetical protein
MNTISDMKTIIALLIATAITAQADLIDLTPGGFSAANELPPALEMLFTQTFFDEAGHGTFYLPDGPTYFDGWISRYGRLNGGRYFFTDLFGRDTPTASVFWNMPGAPDHFGMTMLDVVGVLDGVIWDNIYYVPPSDRFIIPATLVNVHPGTNILGISFYGAPDSGSTIVLFGLTLLLTLGVFKRIIERPNRG